MYIFLFYSLYNIIILYSIVVVYIGNVDRIEIVFEEGKRILGGRY